MRRIFGALLVGAWITSACAVTPAGSQSAAIPTAPSSTVAATSGNPDPTVGATGVAPTPLVRPGEPWILFNAYVQQGLKSGFLMRPDGSDAHRILASTGGDTRALAWSADGSRMAFVYQGPSAAKDGEIWTALADGSDATKLLDGAPGCSGAFYPGWSPDDMKMAFVCYTADGNGKLSVYDIATRKITDLVSLVWPEVFDNPVRWSPDGKTIAFDVLRWDPTNQFLEGSQVATVSASGGKVERLTKLETFFAHPSWRPDGKALVVNTYDQGNMLDTDQASNLYELALDGTVLRQITNASTGGKFRITQPSWDPAGARIWVTLWRPGVGITCGSVDAATGAYVDLGVDGSQPQMRPAP